MSDVNTENSSGYYPKPVETQPYDSTHKRMIVVDIENSSHDFTKDLVWQSPKLVSINRLYVQDTATGSSTDIQGLNQAMTARLLKDEHITFTRNFGSTNNNFYVKNDWVKKVCKDLNVSFADFSFAVTVLLNDDGTLNTISVAPSLVQGDTVLPYNNLNVVKIELEVY